MSSGPDQRSALRRSLDLAGSLGAGAVRASLAAPAAAIQAGRALERETRRVAGEAVSQVGLGALDAVLASRFTDQAVERALRSRAAEQAVTAALSGPLVESLARDVARYSVLERVTREVVTPEAIDELTTALLEGDALDQVLDRIEVSGERLVTRAIDSPATEKLVSGVIDSRLLDQVVTRLLESEELWLLVEEIARSPAVTEAITQQSLGFADIVADEVRQRSSNADAWLERAARRRARKWRAADEPPAQIEEPAEP